MDLQEKFSTEKHLTRHYNKHKVEFNDIELSKKDYEILAEDLQSKEVDNKNIFGYIGEYKNKQAYYKYDKSTSIFVAYYYKNGRPITITCYTQSFRKFQARKAENYISEIPKGK